MVQRIVDLADDEAEVQCRRENDEEGKNDFFEIHDASARPDLDQTVLPHTATVAAYRNERAVSEFDFCAVKTIQWLDSTMTMPGAA
jgi:hypothetical protein